MIDQIQQILAIPDPAAREQFLRARILHQARASVLACSRCDLRPQCNAPTPAQPSTFSPTPHLAIVLPWPGLKPEATALLHGALAQHAGIAAGHCITLYALSCQPLSRPTPAQYHACRPHLEAQLAASGAKVIAVFGMDAGPEFMPNDRLYSWNDEIRGHGIEDEQTDRVFFFLDHPLDVCRNPRLRPAFELDMIVLGRLLHYRFVSKAVSLFRSGDGSWPELLTGSLYGLNPAHADDSRRLFTTRVLAEAGASKQQADQVFRAQSDLFPDHGTVPPPPDAITTPLRA